MAVAASRVAVGTAATVIAAADADGQTVILVNRGTIDIELGGPGVAIGAGFLVVAGASLTVALAPGEELYGINGGAAGTTVPIHLLRTRA